MTRARYRLLAPAALALALAACGVKGQVLPPGKARPERITDLKATADKDGIRLSWKRPERYVEGGTMRDLAGFAILRGEGGQPLKPLANVPITDRERFQKVRRFDYLDTATGMGHTYSYEVISATDSGYRSAPSNLVVFTRVAPPPIAPEKFALPQPSPLP